MIEKIELDLSTSLINDIVRRSLIERKQAVSKDMSNLRLKPMMQEWDEAILGELDKFNNALQLVINKYGSTSEKDN